jgi:hypothetical protein
MASDMTTSVLKVFEDPDEKQILSAELVESRIQAFLDSKGIDKTDVAGMGFLGDFVVVIHT